MEGSALGIVLKTGDETYLGIIAQQTAQIQQGSTPLQQEIKEFVKFNSILGICLGKLIYKDLLAIILFLALLLLKKLIFMSFYAFFCFI